MNTEQQHILFVEDNRIITMDIADVLEDVGFKTGSHFDYELDDIVAHFAYSQDEARRLIRARPYTAVFLDHELDEKRTTEKLVQEIFRRNPKCTVMLTSGSPEVQLKAISAVLTEDGLESYVSLLKIHSKSNMSGLTHFLNDIIRPPSLAPYGPPHAHAKCES